MDNRLLSRRRMLELSGAAGLAAALAGCDSAPAQTVSRVTAPPPKGVLGANFNGDTDWANFAELQAVSATWLRGFFPMPDADNGNVAGQPVIRTLLDASSRGYGTVLSMKFPYFDQNIPTPGSAAMATALKRLDTVLAAVLGKVDILAVGNEPFIECKKEERASPHLNVFYETMAKHTIASRGQNTKTRLYMGALNHLDLPEWKTPATERWMTFVKNTPELDGVDIHPHLSAVAAGQDYLDYILPRMRSGQTFLATEFSLVLLFATHLKDPVSTEFATKYGIPAGTLVWQVIADATKQPFPQQKWTDFLSMSPWFANNSNFVHDQVGKFRATGRLAVATYGITQDKAMASNFDAKSTPWVLNSLFCPYTVQSGSNGLPGQTVPWVSEFRALQ